MSAERVIQARYVDHDRVEAFPYFAAQFSRPLDGEGDDDDAPLGSSLSTPEEDARRLASVDQIIFERHQEAERDAQETARRAYEEGFKSGEQEGRAFGESQYRAHVQRLDGHIEEISQSLAINQRAARDEVLALALGLAEYLAGRVIEDGIATLEPLLDAVLEARPFPAGPGDGPDQHTAVNVFLNPKDMEELGEAAQRHPGVTLREDPELSRGGLRLESPIGVLDASLERRKAKALEALQAFREKDQP
jgi:flagellar biosynthesis/type III secretory pathway protein FliH